tara:strand:- start:3273 stop:4160 length:888 start_codon:yes stop_codon:yes gene_type:complete
MTEITAHIFSEKSAHRRTDMSPLQRISDRYAARIETAVEQIVGHAAKVSPEEIRFTAYSEWAEALGPLSSLSIFRLLPLRGSIILHLEESMINSLINVYFGGSIGPVVQRKKDGFRDTELQLIERLAQSLMEQLCGYFSDHGPMKPAFLRHETSAAYITGYDPNEQVMCQTFQINMGGDISWQIELAYSAEATESMMEFIQNKNVETPAESDPRWQQQWSNNLKQIHLPLRTILAQPTMRLPELFALKPGDIIPITPRVKPPLFVANRKFATGTLGEKNGCAAFKIEHMEQGNTR